MKFQLICTLILLLFQIGLFSQVENSEIKVVTNKETYAVNEEILVMTESKFSFSLMTNGDCNSSIIYPRLIKEIEGKFPELEAMRQMCCGLPYTQPMNRYESEFQIKDIGRYKVVVYTSSGMMFSNIFEVKE